MTEKIEPMTAAEWRAEDFSGGIAVRYPRVLAALEEREALLGEREAAIGTTAMGAVLECEADSVKRGEKFNVEARVNVLRAAARRVRELEGECEKWKQDARVPTAHARLGSLVAAIREHKMFDCIAVFPRDKRGPLYGFPDANGLTNALAHLDSLLPKEPEVAPSGWRYEWGGDRVFQIDHIGRRTPIDDGPTDEMVPPCDAPVVAALLAGGGK